jgi:DNA-binding HxlR family transcriptional regulator
MRTPANLFLRSCPSRTIIDLIGSRWGMLLICALRGGPVRANELIRKVDGISQKMFTQTVRGLERNGLVKRTSYAEVPPRVEYALTALGRDLSRLITRMERWVVDNYDRVMEAREAV